MLSSGFTYKETHVMKKLMILLLLCLTACSSESQPPAESAPEAAANESAAETAPAGEPAPASETAPADPAAPAAATSESTPAVTAPKPAAPPATAKSTAKPADKTGATLKPGVYAHFETNMGNFTAELNEKEAPITVANFVGLASGTKEWTDPRSNQKVRKPYYDGLTFHRIIDGFMIQGGDPLGSGIGGPGFTIKDEYNNLKHDKPGVMAMARTSAPDSAGSQFYITVAAPTFLDGQRPPYVIFGQVVEGLDVVLNIGKTPTGPNDRPVKPVVINRVRIEKVK
jgi:peptidyl-prolyl cis-trans isomerase A (cyclophilin A)